MAKTPEGIFFVSSQGHWRYGNKDKNEEWLIPTSKIKLSESTLSFGKAITSNGYYTDITNKSKDTCFGITLEETSSRTTDGIDAADAVDGYKTHIIQSGILRFNTTDFNSCFENRTYNIGDKIYLNSSGKFTNDFATLVKSPYRIIEIGEITNIFGSTNYDLSVKIINHNKIETDSVEFVGTCASSFNISTNMIGNHNICVMAWEESTGKFVPADIEDNRNVAGIFIGNINTEMGNQIKVTRNGKIYLDSMIQSKNGNSWNNMSIDPGTQLYLEKDGSISSAPYINSESTGYSCPILIYLGTNNGKYEFYVNIETPKLNKLDELYLTEEHTATIVKSSSLSSYYISPITFSTILNYGSYNEEELFNDLDIKLYVKAKETTAIQSKYNGYIFKDSWTEVKPGFFHYDTIRSYGYVWKLQKSGSNYNLVMDIQDGFGLAIESGKNSGPILCSNDDFICKVIVRRFNDSQVNLDFNNMRITGNTLEKKIKNDSNKFIAENYNIDTGKVTYSKSGGGAVTLEGVTTTTSSKASLKRIYNEDKASEINNNIYGTGGATNSSSGTDKKFDNYGDIMRAIYETPMAVWNYKTDDTSSKEHIGMIIERLSQRKNSSTSFTTRSLNGFETSKTFEYNNTEKTQIRKLINLITDTNETGIDNTNVQGILFKALKETQQRLLDLEAATFGPNSSRITANGNNSSQIDQNGVNNNSLDYGSNRVLRALCLEIFGVANPSDSNTEFDIDNGTLFDNIQKLLMGTEFDAQKATWAASAAKSVGEYTQNSKYYSYNDDAQTSGDGFTTNGTNVLATDDARKYRFNGIDDFISRICNKVDILSKSVFQSENVNKKPTYTGSLLTFECDNDKFTF